MKVYFVRHGQSVLNAENKHQFPDTPLSILGEKQAEFVAKRFRNIKVEKIISSSYKRTQQTAEIVNEKLNLEIEFTDLATECRRPSEVCGVKLDSPINIAIQNKIKKNFHKINWHYSDEENFIDYRERASKLIIKLQELKENSILLISHGVYIRVLVGVMMFGQKMTSKEYLKWDNFAKSENTGLTLCEFDRENKKWSLLTWNDYAHLG